MRTVDLVIVICWAAFWAYWIAAAFAVKPGQSRRSRDARGGVAIIVVIIFLVRELGFRAHPVENDPVLTGIGLALFIAGLALAVWARVFIGRNWGTPMSRSTAA